MNIVYKLTNLDRESGRRFYIGSKAECFIESINGIDRIVSSKTGLPYYGSSSCPLMKQDMAEGHRFSAEILEEVPNKKSMLEVEDSWITKLDATSGKLNMIIQLPYLIKSPGRKKQAEERRNELEKQMSESANGIGYIDGTERITQLNRSIDNNLQTQIQYIETTLKTQLGITDGILNGTASEQETTNYLSRCIEPVVAAIADEMKRKFLTKTARTQKQSILFFRDPFKIMPISTIATVGQAMTQIEAMSSNEVRQIIGLKPSSNPRADELRNKNLSKSDAEVNAELS